MTRTTLQRPFTRQEHQLGGCVAALLQVFSASLLLLLLTWAAGK